MLIVAFVQWWYGPGWKDTGSRLLARVDKTYLEFSVPILLRTMFAPWKRIITYAGTSINDRTRAALDNLISRTIGFLVRMCALGAALFIIGTYMIVGGLILITWPILPILGPILVVWGLL
jgi:hypothetical protein